MMFKSYSLRIRIFSFKLLNGWVLEKYLQNVFCNVISVLEICAEYILQVFLLTKMENMENVKSKSFSPYILLLFSKHKNGECVLSKWVLELGSQTIKTKKWENGNVKSR